MIPRYRTMDSYRVEKQSTMRIILEDADAEIEPAPTVDSDHKSEPVLDRSSNIVKAFNEQVGTNCSDVDRVSRRILEAIVPRVAADNAFQNAARHSDRQNARIEHDKALGRVMPGLSKTTQNYSSSSATMHRSADGWRIWSVGWCMREVRRRRRHRRNLPNCIS